MLFSLSCLGVQVVLNYKLQYGLGEHSLLPAILFVYFCLKLVKDIYWLVFPLNAKASFSVANKEEN